MSTETTGQHYLSVTSAVLRSQKSLADRAIAQVTDDGLHWRPDPESNSIAILMKHLAGNMLSRWTDFLTTDGEKPTRNRDDEFVDERKSRAELMALWNRGWRRLFDTLDGLAEAELLKTVTISGRPLSVVEAIERQLSHYGYHVGQIVYIARHLAGPGWKSLSIPKRKAGQT